MLGRIGSKGIWEWHWVRFCTYWIWGAWEIGVRQVRCLGEKCNEELTFNVMQVQGWPLQRVKTFVRWVSGCVGLKATERNGLTVGFWDPAYVILQSTDLTGVKRGRKKRFPRTSKEPQEGKLIRESETHQQQNHMEALARLLSWIEHRPNTARLQVRSLVRAHRRGNQ